MNMRNVVLLALIVPSLALNFEPMLTLHVNGTINSISTSMGLVSVASDVGAYLFNGTKVLLKLNGDYVSTSSYSNVFAFVRADGKVTLYDVLHKVKVNLKLPSHVAKASKVTQKGLLLCWKVCAFYNFQGRKLWEFDVKEVIGKPAGEESFYIPDALANQIYAISGGKLLMNRTVNFPLSVASCDDLIAVGTWSKVYLFDKNFDELNVLYGFKRVRDLAFSPDCKYLAIADSLNNRLVIVDTKGTLVKEVRFDVPVNGMDWKGNVMVISLDNGNVKVYKVLGYEPLEEEVITLLPPPDTTLFYGLASLLLLALIAVAGLEIVRSE